MSGGKNNSLTMSFIFVHDKEIFKNHIQSEDQKFDIDFVVITRAKLFKLLGGKCIGCLKLRHFKK